MRALLFDIDGTLTRSDGAGNRSLAAALHARPRAAEELRRMRMDGMTDPSIVRTLLAAEGDSSVPIAERAHKVDAAAISAVLAGYLVALEKECAAGGYRTLPGVPALLASLAARSDVMLCLCTGNLETGARLKLTSTGLWHHFPFGGFASDAEHRPDIVRAAWARARERGATDGLVIGDTPRDVLAAHEAGLPACGVATGRYSLHDLGAHGAEVLTADFSDLAAAEKLLLGPLPAPGRTP